MKQSKMFLENERWEEKELEYEVVDLDVVKAKLNALLNDVGLLNLLLELESLIDGRELESRRQVIEKAIWGINTIVKEENKDFNIK